jgi:hypothetical protein
VKVDEGLRSVHDDVDSDHGIFALVHNRDAIIEEEHLLEKPEEGLPLCLQQYLDLVELNSKVDGMPRAFDTGASNADVVKCDLTIVHMFGK